MVSGAAPTASAEFQGASSLPCSASSAEDCDRRDSIAPNETALEANSNGETSLQSAENLTTFSNENQPLLDAQPNADDELEIARAPVDYDPMAEALALAKKLRPRKNKKQRDAIRAPAPLNNLDCLTEFHPEAIPTNQIPDSSADFEASTGTITSKEILDSSTPFQVCAEPIASNGIETATTYMASGQNRENICEIAPVHAFASNSEQLSLHESFPRGASSLSTNMAGCNWILDLKSRSISLLASLQSRSYHSKVS